MNSIPFIFIEKRRSSHRSKTTEEEHLASQDACNGLWLTSSYVVSARKHSLLDMHRRDTRKLCTQRKKSWQNVLKRTSEMAVKHPKIAEKSAIIRRKDGYLTWDSMNSNLKGVPHSNLIIVNTVEENFSMLKRNMTTKSDVAM